MIFLYEAGSINTVDIYSALWLLMDWCFSIKTSVAAVLSTHLCVSSCLWVNELTLQVSVLYIHGTEFCYHFSFDGPAPTGCLECQTLAAGLGLMFMMGIPTLLRLLRLHLYLKSAICHAHWLICLSILTIYVLMGSS